MHVSLCVREGVKEAHRCRPSSQEMLQGDTDGATSWRKWGGERRTRDQRGGAVPRCLPQATLKTLPAPGGVFLKLQTRLANFFAELVQNIFGNREINFLKQINRETTSHDPLSSKLSQGVVGRPQVSSSQHQEPGLPCRHALHTRA